MPIDFSVENGIALVGMNRPEAKNALDAGMLKGLQAAWDQVAENDEIRVAVLYSALPEIFCAGMDLNTVIPILNRAKEPTNEDEVWLAEQPHAIFTSILKQRTWYKPVVAAVHGLCLTGGWEMVMGADLRVASDKAVFQMREPTFGFMPFGGSHVFLPREIPLAAAKEILCLGQEVTASRLYGWGFLNRMTSPDLLMDEAMGMARRICDMGPLAVKGSLRCIQETAGMDLDSALNKELEIGLPIIASADAREGVAAFKEGRKPKFQGK